jgi:hypothetical protein
MRNDHPTNWNTGIPIRSSKADGGISEPHHPRKPALSTFCHRFLITMVESRSPFKAELPDVWSLLNATSRLF